MGTGGSVARGQSLGETRKDVGSSVELKRPVPGRCHDPGPQRDTQCDVIALR